MSLSDFQPMTDGKTKKKMSTEKDVQEKECEESTATGCGCLFLLVLGYCLLSAFLVFPTGWNVSEIFYNKIALIVLAVLVVLIIARLSPYLWSEIREVSLFDLRQSLKYVWPSLGILLLIFIARMLMRLVFKEFNL